MPRGSSPPKFGSGFVHPPPNSISTAKSTANSQIHHRKSKSDAELDDPPPIWNRQWIWQWIRQPTLNPLAFNTKFTAESLSAADAESTAKPQQNMNTRSLNKKLWSQSCLTPFKNQRQMVSIQQTPNNNATRQNKRQGGFNSSQHRRRVSILALSLL